MAEKTCAHLCKCEQQQQQKLQPTGCPASGLPLNCAAAENRRLQQLPGDIVPPQLITQRRRLRILVDDDRFNAGHLGEIDHLLGRHHI